jgi:hypothetical protein
MSRHHPVNVSYRHKGRELARRVVCRCGCDWTQHQHRLPAKPCGGCGCRQFTRPAGRQSGFPATQGGPDA